MSTSSGGSTSCGYSSQTSTSSACDGSASEGNQLIDSFHLYQSLYHINPIPYIKPSSLHIDPLHSPHSQAYIFSISNSLFSTFYQSTTPSYYL